MSQVELVKQGEIFPQDSPLNSKYALKMRHAERATAATLEEKHIGRPAHDILGQRFGMLTVEAVTDEIFAKGRVYTCRCDCGHEIRAIASHLTRKKKPITHCGCQGISRFRVSRPGSRGIGGYNSGKRRQVVNPMMAFRGLYSNCRLGAARRGYSWELTEEQFLKLTQGNCHYCGAAPYQVYISLPHKFIYNGVDRLDNSKSYTPDNCVSCCGTCNRAKLDRNEDDFLEWVKRVCEYRDIR